MARLRCSLSKSGEDYVAECLDLGLVVIEKHADEARASLLEAIDLYIDTFRNVAARGEKPVRRPAPFYRLWEWELRRRLQRASEERDKFVLTKEVPVLSG